MRFGLGLVVAAALALAGCGGGGGAGGSATLWITRDRGARVVEVARVPAGLTAMQALARKAKVETRYGGRFVEAIDGLHGSAAAQRDWFYFVNGYEADVGAAEYRLHAGDVEWWDYRSWKGSAIHVPVVVGAFPEPFVHGYAGKRRPTVVIGAPTPAVRAVARLVHGRVCPLQCGDLGAANVLRLVPSTATSFEARPRGTRPGSPVEFTYHGDLRRLARNPSLARFRYSLP